MDALQAALSGRRTRRAPGCEARRCLSTTRLREREAGLITEPSCFPEAECGGRWQGRAGWPWGAAGLGAQLRCSLLGRDGTGLRFDPCGAGEGGPAAVGTRSAPRVPALLLTPRCSELSPLLGTAGHGDSCWRSAGTRADRGAPPGRPTGAGGAGGAGGGRSQLASPSPWGEGIKGLQKGCVPAVPPGRGLQLLGSFQVTADPTAWVNAVPSAAQSSSPQARGGGDGLTVLCLEALPSSLLALPCLSPVPGLCSRPQALPAPGFGQHRERGSTRHGRRRAVSPQHRVLLLPGAPGL